MIDGICYKMTNSNLIATGITFTHARINLQLALDIYRLPVLLRSSLINCRIGRTVDDSLATENYG